MNRFVLENLPIVFIVVGVIYAIFRSNRKRLYELADKIPGENGLPIIGHLHKFLTNDMSKHVKVIQEGCDKKLPLSKGWLGAKFAVLTQDPETIHAIYNSPHCLNKPGYLYNSLYTKLGLLTVNGKTYEKHRKIFNRCFKPSVLHNLVPVFNEKAMKCVEMLKEQDGKGEFNIYKYIGACSLEAFGAGQLNFDKNFYESDVLSAVEE